MPATRAQLIVGVPKIVRDTYVSHSQTDATITLQEALSPVNVGGQEIDKRFLEYIAKLTFQPDGRFPSALVTLLNSLATLKPGASGFGSSDTPTVVTGSDGATHTLASSGLIDSWEMDFHPDRNLINALTLTGIIGTGKVLSDASSLYDVGSGGTYEDSTFTHASVIRQQYTGALSGVTGLTSIEAQDGFKVSFTPQFEALKVAGVTRDFKFKGMGVMVRFIPAGATTAANILDALQADSGSARKPGGSLHASAASFTLTGADSVVYLTIPKATPSRGQFDFSSIKLRTGEIALYGCRPATSGDLSTALYTLANA